MTPLSRRHFTLASAAGLAAAAIPGSNLLARVRDDKRVVCYTSADSVYAKVLLAEFTKATGIAVDAVFDTEATKTTGLVQRLLTEHSNPEARGGRADVWWCSEPFGTIKLARAGVLDEVTALRAEERMKQSGGSGWPANLRAGDKTWYGFGSRARVIVYNTRFVKEPDAPRTLGQLLRPEFKGRIAIAKPAFGTTRGHFGALVQRFGEPAFEAWLKALKANGLRVLDGNATVVAAVARGECRIGLTDTDDVYAGQREGWPVALAWEELPPRPTNDEKPAPIAGPDLPGMGSMLIPSTVSLVKGRKNPGPAMELVEFLLSPAAQRSLARTDSRNTPVDPEVRKEFAQYDIQNPAELDLFAVADRIDAAMAICSRVLG
jgi:iron(III) transport system substrate-binding protein